jgi:eukaryotic-like serine/threonine-protein kinase
MQPGMQVGAYQVIQQIGEGGMGTVWLAQHQMLGRRAAIKVLHPMFSAQPEIVQRFFNEARSAAAISDPGIVQIFDFGHHSDGSAYIAMEMLEGEPLDKRLHRLGRLPVIDAVRILRQTASSLGVAHGRGIVHRDLKPENIFLIADQEMAGGERAKILDFGIAKLTSDPRIKTQTSAVMGTPAYMSPEQCRGAGLVDERSDVYALGCVLFTLVTGALPFDAEGAGEIIAMHLREPPPAPSSRMPGLPPALDALVLRCLAKDPAQRYPSARELAADLGHLLAQLTGAPSMSGVMAAPSGNFASAPSAPSVPLSGSHGFAPPAAATTLSHGAGAHSVPPSGQARGGRKLVAIGLAVAGVAAAAVIGVVVAGSGDKAAGPGSGSQLAAVTPDARGDAVAAPIDAAGAASIDAASVDAGSGLDPAIEAKVKAWQDKELLKIKEEAMDLTLSKELSQQKLAEARERQRLIREILKPSNQKKGPAPEDASWLSSKLVELSDHLAERGDTSGADRLEGNSTGAGTLGGELAERGENGTGDTGMGGGIIGGRATGARALPEELTKAMIAPYLKRATSRLRQCKLEGTGETVYVSVKVSPDGKSERVDIEGSPSAAVRACINREFKARPWPRTTRGGAFRVPLSLGAAAN